MPGAALVATVPSHKWLLLHVPCMRNSAILWDERKEQHRQPHKPWPAEERWPRSLLQGHCAFAWVSSSLRAHLLALGVFFRVGCAIQNGRWRCHILLSVSHLLCSLLCKPWPGTLLFPNPCIPTAVTFIGDAVTQILVPGLGQEKDKNRRMFSILFPTNCTRLHQVGEAQELSLPNT